jgi:hypothetical protein
MNRVVVHFADGRIVKGVTNDFTPEKGHFHLTLHEAPRESKPADVQTKDVKAIFFVKDFAGNPQEQERKEFDALRPPVGRKIRVVFKDGEVMVGTTHGYRRGRPGFFLVPADPNSNNERCYIVSSATREITFI